MNGPHAFFIIGSYASLAIAIALELWALRRRRTNALQIARQARVAADRYGRSSRREEHAMKPRHQRMIWIGAGLLALGLAVTLILNAFQSNLVFFFTPTQIANGEAPKGKPFRIGGMVVEGSLKRNTEGTGGIFQVTDTAKTVSVAYNGILPDLFKEGRGRRRTRRHVARRIIQGQ